jgi:MFS family permease
MYMFMSNFAIYFMGMGLFPLLPLYAMQFGASKTMVGIYLALTYVSITAGTMLTGRLAARLGRRRLFVGAGVLGVPALVLLGQATALWQVTVLTAFIWFVSGIGTALASVLTALYADGEQRGKSFGLMYLTMPLASLASGVVVGQLIAWQGYPLMFNVLAGVWIIFPLVGLLGVQDEPGRAAQAVADAPAQPLSGVFYLIVGVVLLSMVANYLARLGSSISMQALHFSARDISSATAISGLVAIPVTLLIGTLSDRLGRQRFLMLAYGLMAAGTLTLMMATQLWQFWFAAAAMLTAKTAGGSVASAYATDLLDAEAVNRGLPKLNAASWMSGIVGLGGGGALMDAVGPANTYLIATLMSVAAAGLVGFAPRQRQIESEAAAPAEWQAERLVVSSGGCTTI